MSEEKEMTFLEHLEELRWHIIRALVAIMVFTIFAFIETPWIFDHVVFAPAKTSFATYRWLCHLADVTGYKSLCVTSLPFKIQSRYMTGQFTMQITASMVIGLVMAFPYVFWEIWQFVKPGLYKNEKSASGGAVAGVTFLFALGVAFGYYLLCPFSVWFLANYQISDLISNEFDITSYVSTVVTLVLGSALLFQLPMVVYFLTKIGIVTPNFLRTYRKHAVVVILIVAAVITPPDPFSQIIVALPLYMLYEVSIFISAVVKRNKDKKEALEEQQGL